MLSASVTSASYRNLKVHLVIKPASNSLKKLVIPYYIPVIFNICWVAVISAKNHKRQRRKRQSVTAKREESQTPKFLTAILTLPNLT